MRRIDWNESVDMVGPVLVGPVTEDKTPEYAVMELLALMRPIESPISWAFYAVQYTIHDDVQAIGSIRINLQADETDLTIL